MGKRLAIFAGNRVIAMPILRAPLTGPDFEVTTDTDAELDELAKALGAL